MVFESLGGGTRFTSFRQLMIAWCLGQQAKCPHPRALWSAYNSRPVYGSTVKCHAVIAGIKIPRPKKGHIRQNNTNCVDPISEGHLVGTGLILPQDMPHLKKCMQLCYVPIIAPVCS